MNKHPHRSEPHQHLARIQANLQQMKQKVTEYLQKQNKIEVPSIAKPRHYLIVNYLKNGHLEENSSLQCLKIQQQTSAIKAAKTNTARSPHYPQNQKGIYQQDGQILARRKKLAQHQHLSKRDDEDCALALPSIYNIKLLNVQNNQQIEHHKLSLTRRKKFQNKVEELQNHRTLQFVDGRKKYHSIDLNARKSIYNFKPYHEEPYRSKESWIEHYTKQEAAARKEKTRNIFDIPVDQYIQMTPGGVNQTKKTKTQSQNNNGIYQKRQNKYSPEMQGTTLDSFLKIQQQKIIPMNKKTITMDQIDKIDEAKLSTIFDTQLDNLVDAKIHQKSSHLNHRRIYCHLKKQQKIVNNQINQNHCDCNQCTPWQTPVQNQKSPLFMDIQNDFT